MRHNLILSCEKSKLSELRGFLNGVLDKSQLSEIAKNQVVLAVDEVCSNLMIHSHQCNPNDKIYLEVFQTESKLVIEIKDSGEGFNILEYKQPELAEVKRKRRKGGLGIMLVKKIMDNIEFESTGTQNTCRLTKMLNSK
ncbi:ATP-binding protein [Litoribacter ruber]|uniref:ATP-binding protein n=1 Tax=Litoribacter ruber TaxID=702568 RepID=A0AAP2CLV2_9BACT|nr:MULTISPECIES: ATP-binding protein [Litoribacter]MBS9524232.1 ATP-binding protein [Litoribacter alkaliphilus]MBT0809970.1 ATP-binding protein [Litoribacter ruber]